MRTPAETKPKYPLPYYRTAVCLFFFFQGFCFASWASRIPDFKAAFGLSDGRLGTLLFAYPLGQFLAVFINGYLVERFTSRKCLAAAAFLYPLTLTLLGAVPYFGGALWQFAFLLFLMGIVSNLHNLCVNTQAVGVETAYGRNIMSVFHGCWSLAGCVVGFVSSYIAVRAGAPFHQYLGILVFSPVMVFGLGRFTLKRDFKSEDAREEKPTFHVFKGMDRFLYLVGFLAFAGMLCEGAVYDWCAIYFKDYLHVDEAFVRAGYTACMLAITGFRFLDDAIAEKIGNINLLRLGSLSATVGFLLMVFVPRLWISTLGAALVGAGISAIVPICYRTVSQHRGIVAGRAINAISTIGFFGLLVGPPVIGQLAELIGLRRVFALVALLAASIGLLASRLKN